MTDNEKAKERAIAIWQKQVGIGTRDLRHIFAEGFDAGYAAATVPADEEVWEAVEQVSTMLETWAAGGELSPHEDKAIRTLIAAVSGDELQRELDYLYSQERNVELSSFWDAGWRLRLGDVTNGFIDDGRFDSLTEVAEYLRGRRIDGPKGDEQKEQKTARIIIWWELNDGSQNIETDKPEMTGAEIMEAAKNRGWLRPWQKILVEMLPNGTNRIIGQLDAIRLHQFMKFSAIGNDDND